jgi:membrane protein
VKLPGGGGMSAKEFVKSLAAEYSRDNVGDGAGAVTYAGILALFPFLLFLVSLASVIIDPAQAEQLVQSLSRFAPAEVTKIVGDRIRSLGESQNVGLLTVGALGAIWAASGGIQALMRALNTVYGVRESRPFWKVKAIAVGMTLVSGVLAIAAAVVAIVSPALANFIGGPIGTAILWLRLPVAGLAMMLLWALLYYVLPDVEQKFKFITPGSVGGVILWLAASAAFSVYVTNFGKFDATYGSLGGIIVLLLWMWISSLVLLVGAESNAIIEHRSHEGKRAGEKSLAEHGSTGTKHEELAPTTPGQGAREGQERPTRRTGRWDGAARPPPLGPRVGHAARRGGKHRGFDVAWVAGLVAGALLLRRGRAHA